MSIAGTITSGREPPAQAPARGGGFTLAQLVRLPNGPQRIVVLDQLHTLYSKRFRQARKIRDPRQRAQVIADLGQQWATLRAQAGSEMAS
jgi:hypothetical protein